MRIMLAIAALAIAGCSQKSETPTANATASRSPSAAPKACDILTEADAKTALAHDVKRLPNDGGPAGLDICQYGYQGERLADMGQVSVTVHPVDLGTAISAAKEQGYELEPVNGLGDEAFYSSQIGLYVGKGDRTAIYLLGAEGLKDAKERTVAVARATADRL